LGLEQLPSDARFPDANPNFYPPAFGSHRKSSTCARDVHNRRRIVPTYRVPAAVRAIPSKVELGGPEPAISWVQ
jgi:hypothetical protein